MRGFDHATFLSPSFHGVRKERLAQWPAFCDPKFRPKIPGVLPEKLGGVQHASWNPYSISDQNLWFSLSISDLIKNLIPYFRPEALEPGVWPERVTSCYGMYTVVGVNIKREMVLSPNDEEVANSSKKHTQFKTRVHKPYPFSDQNGRKTIPFGAAHTYIAYIRDYPPGRKTRCRLWVSLLTQARLIKPKCLKSDQPYKLHHTGKFGVLGRQNSNDNLVVTVEPNSPIGPKGIPNHIGYNSCQVMLTSVRELSWWEGSRLPWDYRLS